jgi:hypothetical protein
MLSTVHKCLIKKIHRPSKVLLAEFSKLNKKKTSPASQVVSPSFKRTLASPNAAQSLSTDSAASDLKLASNLVTENDRYLRESYDIDDSEFYDCILSS